MTYRKADGDVNVPKIIGHSIAGLFILILLFGTFGTVGAGERGVKTRFGAVTGSVLNSGLYFKLPFIEGVEKMNVQNQKEQTVADAASSDLQTVKAEIALNYNLAATR